MLKSNTNNHTTVYEQAFGKSGKENFPFNRRNPLAEPGSGKGSQLPLLVGGCEQPLERLKHYQEGCNNSLAKNCCSGCLLNTASWWGRWDTTEQNKPQPPQLHLEHTCSQRKKIVIVWPVRTTKRKFAICVLGNTALTPQPQVSTSRINCLVGSREARTSAELNLSFSSWKAWATSRDQKKT